MSGIPGSTVESQPRNAEPTLERDLELVDARVRAVHPDLQGYEDLFRSAVESALHAVESIGASPEVAEDAALEALDRTYRLMLSGLEPTNVRALFMTSAIDVAADRMAAQPLVVRGSRRGTRHSRAPLGAAAPLVFFHDSVRLTMALGSLTEDQRNVTAPRLLEGQSFRHIAAAIGTDLASALWRYYWGKTRLLAALDSLQNPDPAEAGARYPEALRNEYRSLVQKKLQKTLSEDEAARLDEVRAEINRRDSEHPSWIAYERRSEEVDREVNALRAELEGFPDA
jgi:DNA-directed RNA polymerase specialized sigma24 family protein